MTSAEARDDVKASIVRKNSADVKLFNLFFMMFNSPLLIKFNARLDETLPYTLSPSCVMC